MNQNNLEFLIECACRYNIGRRSYSPHWFCDIVEHHLDTLSSKCLTNILHDVQNAEPNRLGRETEANRWRDLKRKIEARLQDAER